MNVLIKKSLVIGLVAAACLTVDLAAMRSLRAKPEPTGWMKDLDKAMNSATEHVTTLFTKGKSVGAQVSGKLQPGVLAKVQQLAQQAQAKVQGVGQPAAVAQDSVQPAATPRGLRPTELPAKTERPTSDIPLQVVVPPAPIAILGVQKSAFSPIPQGPVGVVDNAKNDHTSERSASSSSATSSAQSSPASSPVALPATTPVTPAVTGQLHSPQPLAPRYNTLPATPPPTPMTPAQVAGALDFVTPIVAMHTPAIQSSIQPITPPVTPTLTSHPAPMSVSPLSLGATAETHASGVLPASPPSEPGSPVAVNLTSKFDASAAAAHSSPAHSPVAGSPSPMPGFVSSPSVSPARMTDQGGRLQSVALGMNDQIIGFLQKNPQEFTVMLNKLFEKTTSFSALVNLYEAYCAHVDQTVEDQAVRLACKVELLPVFEANLKRFSPQLKSTSSIEDMQATSRLAHVFVGLTQAARTQVQDDACATVLEQGERDIALRLQGLDDLLGALSLEADGQYRIHEGAHTAALIMAQLVPVLVMVGTNLARQAAFAGNVKDVKSQSRFQRWGLACVCTAAVFSVYVMVTNQLNISMLPAATVTDVWSQFLRMLPELPLLLAQASSAALGATTSMTV